MLLCGLAGAAAGQTYSIRVSLSPNDFLGACNQTLLTAGELGGYGECVGEFFNPTIPNPTAILDPITGEGLAAKVEAVNVFNLSGDAGINDILTKFVNIPIVLIGSLLELIASAVKYILIFGVKFIFVYLFYVSLGFQSIILMLDQNSRGLDDVRKLQASIGIMAIATILTLAYGGGWIAW